MDNLEYLVLLFFMIYAVYLGFKSRAVASKSQVEYFLAGRSLEGWKAGTSMAATQYSADTPLLVAGLVATGGIFQLWRLWGYVVAFLLLAFLFGPCWRRSGVVTDAELTELRYGGRLALALRIIKAIHLGTVFNCTVLAMVLIAAGRIAEQFFFWDLWLPEWVFNPIRIFVESVGFSLASLPVNHDFYWVVSTNNFISLIIVVGFTWLYSMTGGLRAVVSTDVIQFAIMILGTAGYALVVLSETGGFSGMSEKLVQLYGSSRADAFVSFVPSVWDTSTILLCSVLSIQWLAQLNADGTGYLAQRSMACRSDRDSTIAGVTFTLLQILLRSILWLPIIIGLLVIYPIENFPSTEVGLEQFKIQREALFATGIKELLPLWARCLMLTAMMAALASTIDTHLNWGASYWSNDLYRRALMEKLLHRNPSSRELVFVARFSNALILTLALIVAANISSIQQAWHISLLFGSGMGLVLVLRWVWYRVNAYCELSAGLVSLVSAGVLLYSYPEMAETARLLWVFAISSLAVIAVALGTSPEADEQLAKFYQTVHPPGYWGKFSSDNAADRNRLWRALMLTFLGSLSLILMLVAFGLYVF